MDSALSEALPSPLRLRPFRADDEEVVVAGHRAMAAADGFTFALGYEPGMRWADYLSLLEDQRKGVNLPADQVPSTFLAAEAAGTLVGRTSIRHALNDYLAREGGHIGYGVLAQYRRRGYATEILRQSLVIARAIGLDRVLVTCDDSNIGSATVIEKCGGQLDSVVSAVTPPPRMVRRYWFE
jgi:predicted acetyltransferase